ncbi:MAG: cupin domain-containing protein [Myxacorys californica WJT36-NPBG1]|jgi:quercetin dioxygenase-like cupin family protein|nr:cupin domain-containing protein [Myxacorys californica WJT36-NPBG1]
MITQATRTEIKNLTEFNSETLFGATITRLLSHGKLSTIGFDHVRIAKGSSLKPHIHAASEAFVYILEGTGVVTLENRNYWVRAGDTIYVPAGVSHGFSTPNEDVVLLSVQSPPIYREEKAPDINFSSSSP